jgi:hypothetical protein
MFVHWKLFVVDYDDDDAEKNEDDDRSNAVVACRIKIINNKVFWR